MSYVSSRELLTRARAEHYAVGAFNVENMEMAQAVLEAAAELRSPVLIQTTPGTLSYAPPRVFAGMISRMAAAAPIPAALHLDHGNSVELAQACVKEGYTSLMIDGSLLPFEENIALTKSVLALAGDIPVEAELGTVGGKEDTHSAGIAYTDPEQAEEFVRRTGVFSLAPAIGTAHGVYKSEPKLDLARLEEIAARVPNPLVLHGTSGVPDETVKACIALGIAKVNYATDLRIAFSRAVESYLAENPGTIDPKKYLGAAREAVKARVKALIRVCGSEGKA